MIRILSAGSILTLVITAIASPLCADPPAAAALRATANDQGIQVHEGDRPVLFYQRSPKSLQGKHERANYVHPLYDLDGNILTEDFPTDHPHHRGIFWTWHQVWLGERKLGDPWLASDFSWEVRQVETMLANPDLLQLRCHVTWTSPQAVDELQTRLPLVRETTTIGVHRAGPNHRKIDFQIHLQALQPGIRLGGSDDVKGYGGFSPRIQLPPDVRFRGVQGPVEPLRTAVEGGAWIDIVGNFASKTATSGLAILCHPSIPGFPQKWILRSSGSMQNAVYPGRQAVPLPLQTPLLLSYRLVLHRGEPSTSELSRWQQEFATPPATAP